MSMKAPSKVSTQIQFHYVKASQFRVVHVDGIVGGLTPRGLLHMAPYSERPAIPQVVVHEIGPDGRLGHPPVQQMGRSGVVRELEVDLMIDLKTMEAIHEWLGDRLAEAKKLKLSRRRG
jgi:hypothetical protein